MHSYALLIALILFFYGNTTFKIAWLRKTLDLSWGMYMTEAVSVIVTAAVIAIAALTR